MALHTTAALLRRHDTHALSLSQAAISRSTQCVSRLIVRRVRRRRAIIKPFWERQSKRERKRDFLALFCGDFANRRHFGGEGGLSGILK